MQKQLNAERELKQQAYDRLEGLRVEMKALESKDNKSDLWRDKCRELFDICKNLEKENEDLKSIVKDANQANLIQAGFDRESDVHLSNQGPEMLRTVAPKSQGNHYDGLISRG